MDHPLSKYTVGGSVNGVVPTVFWKTLLYVEFWELRTVVG